MDAVDEAARLVLLNIGSNTREAFESLVAYVSIRRIVVGSELHTTAFWPGLGVTTAMTLISDMMMTVCLLLQEVSRAVEQRMWMMRALEQVQRPFL